MIINSSRITARDTCGDPLKSTKSPLGMQYFAAPNDLGDKVAFSKIKELHYKYGGLVNDFIKQIPDSFSRQELEDSKFKDIKCVLLPFKQYLETNATDILNAYQEWVNQPKKPKNIDKFHEHRKIVLRKNVERVIYYSKKGDKHLRLNGTAIDKKGEIIKCRQLAFWFLCHDKDYYEQMSNLRKGEIPTSKSLARNFFDKYRIDHVSRSSKLFAPKDFGVALYNQSKDMMVGDKKKFMFYSENHAMAVVVHNKATKHIVVKFYDPNKTAVALRVNLEFLKELENLKLKYFITQGDIDVYFPKIKAGYLAHINTNNIAEAHEQATDINSNLSYSNKLHMALQFGHKEAVEVCIKDVLVDTNLSIVAKKEILITKNGNDTPGLFIALQEGHKEAVEVFIQAVLVDINLSIAAKKEILIAKNKDGTPGLFMALQEDHKDTIEIFVKAVLVDTALSPAAKVEILMAKDGNGISAVQIARQNGRKYIVEVFEKIVLSDKTLTLDEKEEICGSAPPPKIETST